MTQPLLSVVILAAGKGTRMKSSMPKVLHKLAGKPLVEHVIDAVSDLNPSETVLVLGPESEEVGLLYPNTMPVIQHDRLGTGHAVSVTASVLENQERDVLVLFGDTPLVQSSTLERMIAAKNSDQNISLVVAGFEPEDPARYGRVKCNGNGQPQSIIEFKDATEEERTIGLCNGGAMLVAGSDLFRLLEKTNNKNASGEFYLTDLVSLAASEGLGTAMVLFGEDEVLGINSRSELAAAEKLLQEKLRNAAMEQGVTLIDPSTVYFSTDTVLGQDVIIEPNVFIGPGVEIASDTIVKAFSHLEQAKIGSNTQIGPFARLRPGAEIGDSCRIGNFVEVKNATFADGSKANHLAYIGDGDIGAASNIGAGTIFCNYDGINKHRTTLGDGVFIGSNSALVAPITIADGALVAAGSTITRDVSSNALAAVRGIQKEITNGAERFRDRARKKAQK
jgi:bifunctional UDP-N-acetylglucosamine pyrophosphorylase / glucosamine-1-phosphate N-acetyltransferase